jgi:hypothetical protein
MCTYKLVLITLYTVLHYGLRSELSKASVNETTKTNATAEWLGLLLRIRKIRGKIPARRPSIPIEGFRDICESLQENTKNSTKLGHDLFIPLLFIKHPIFPGYVNNLSL